MLDWTLKKDFQGRHYILANRRGFFCRYADTGFRTKWCGFWAPPIKHLEYYAYRIRSESDQWLSWEDCTDFVLNPWGAVHKFRVSGFDVTETAFMPESGPLLVSFLKIRNKGPKKRVSVLLEAAVNMRKKHEDWHARGYESEFSEVRNWVLVKSEARPWFTSFGVGRMDRKIAISFVPKNQYKEHNPGSAQRCFLPGDYEVSFDMDPGEEIEVPFIFSCSSRSLEEAASGFDRGLSGWKSLLDERIRESGPGKQLIRTPDRELNKAFAWNVIALRSLIHESRHGTGVLAGLPWFLEFWARDAFISIPALDDIGELELSRSMLERFLSKNIPSKIDTEGNMEFGFADTYPLFILALHHYANSAGDAAFLSSSKRGLMSITRNVKMEAGLVTHDPDKTWMDSYTRGKSAIEVQSLWSAVLKSYNPGLSREMDGRIKVGYWNPATGYLQDSKNPDLDDMTANAIAPVILEQLDGQKVSHVLDKLQSDFSTKWGVRARSLKDKDYRPDSYHKGAVWGLTTGAAACACFSNNRISQAVGYLKSMASEVGENCVGGSAEVLNADTGELLGCGMQAWSSALFITAVDEFLFGIRPRMDGLEIRPRMPDQWEYMERFGKRVRGHKMDFMMRRDHSRLTLCLNFDSAPGLKARLVLPSNIKKMIANGKVFLGHALELDLKKNNSIVALV
jgi:glycogen debranching enzyme